jgi:hypothetical protein
MRLCALFKPNCVAMLRRGLKNLGLTQRRNGATNEKVFFFRIIKTSRSGVAAWRETFRPHAMTLRRNDSKRNALIPVRNSNVL